MKRNLRTEAYYQSSSWVAFQDPGLLPTI